MSSIEAMKAAIVALEASKRSATVEQYKENESAISGLVAAIKAAQPQGKWVGDKEYWEQPSAISDERIGELWFEIITKGKRPPLEFCRALLAAAPKETPPEETVPAAYVSVYKETK